MKEIKAYRGDIFIANLNPAKGSEQGGKRPVIVLQNDVGNKHSPTVIVASVTSHYRKKKFMPTHVQLSDGTLSKQSQVLLEQIRTIDKSRLIKKIGKATDKNMEEIGQAIRISFALNKKDER